MITSLDSFINNIISYPISFAKSISASEGGGTYMSCFKSSGNPGIGDVGIPFDNGNDATCSGSTLGAIHVPIGYEYQNLYLIRLNTVSSVASSYSLYDRLVSYTGFSCATTGLQTITNPSVIPSRDSYGTNSGYGTEIWGEIHGVPGATAGRWEVYYTNSEGISNRTGVYFHPANAETSGQMMPFLLQTTDKGVRSVDSFRLLTSSATTGNLGLVILRRIAESSNPTIGIASNLNVFDIGMPLIYSGSCLSLIQFCGATTATQVMGTLNFASG